MKKTLFLLAIILFGSFFAVVMNHVMACETNPCCKDGDQVEVHLINGNMMTVTFKVPVPGTYTISYVIKNLKGIPVKRGKAIGVLDCSYGKDDGKVTVYVYLKGRPLKPLTNYMFEITESIETSPEWFEMYYGE